MGDPLVTATAGLTPTSTGYSLTDTTSLLLLLHTTVQLPIFFCVVHVSFQGSFRGIYRFSFLPLG
jgi:hypothetical protein